MSPYIAREQRPKLDTAIAEFIGAVELDTPGKLNYVFTKLALAYLRFQCPSGYSEMNEVVGVFETTKLEFYRRVLAVLEDKKLKENGEVYE